MTSDRAAAAWQAPPELDELARALGRSGPLLVVTGAGISLASGIPTFRGQDPDAIWAHDVLVYGTNAYFRGDPAASWHWYLTRFERLVAARPNVAHHALAALERWQVGRAEGFLLATQNVDTLHDQAGSQALVHVHGRADRVRCTRAGCDYAAPRGSLARPDERLAAFLAAPSLASCPRCPACGAVLRPHVLWFDEAYDDHVDFALGRVLSAAKRAATVLFVGTSFAVGITELVLERASARGARMFSIDPVPRHARPGLVPITATAELALPALCHTLGCDPGAAPGRQGD